MQPWTLFPDVYEDYSAMLNINDHIVGDSEDTPAHSGCKSPQIPGVSGDNTPLLTQSITDMRAALYLTFSYVIRFSTSTTNCGVLTVLVDHLGADAATTPEGRSWLNGQSVSEVGNDWFKTQDFVGRLGIDSRGALKIGFNCDGSIFIDDFAVDYSWTAPTGYDAPTTTTPTPTCTIDALAEDSQGYHWYTARRYTNGWRI